MIPAILLILIVLSLQIQIWRLEKRLAEVADATHDALTIVADQMFPEEAEKAK